jgi:hypothetical protein
VGPSCMPYALLYSYSLVLVPRHGSTDGMHSAAPNKCKVSCCGTMCNELFFLKIVKIIYTSLAR